MVRSFDVSAEFECEAAMFLRDGLSTAFKNFQVRGAAAAALQRGAAASQRKRQRDRGQRLSLSLQLKALGSSAPVIISETRLDGWEVVVRRQQRSLQSLSVHPRDALEQTALNTPPTDPPWPVRRLLGGRRIQYVETRRRRIGAEHRLPLDTHFSSICTVSDRVRVEGTVRIEAAGPGRTRQRFRGTACVSLPTVGPLVERLIVKHIARSYADMPPVVADWMRVRGAALAEQRRAEVRAAVSPAAAREVIVAAAAALAAHLLRVRQVRDDELPCEAMLWTWGTIPY